LTGLELGQEYICVDLAALERKLSITLVCDHFRADVTDTHVFLGYHPLVMAFPFNKDPEAVRVVRETALLALEFRLSDNALSDEKPLAILTLKKIANLPEGTQPVFFFEGLLGKHFFLNPVHQTFNHIRQRFRRKADGNIYLPGNLYDQVRIAYAIPRKISVISLSHQGLMNMFPTDLHGAAGEELYLGSLRLGGMATAQVEQTRRIVLSDVEAAGYREVYAWGRNHMRPLRKADHFLCHPEKSEKFGFPLPIMVTRYLELELTGSFDAGIHRIHQYRVVTRQLIKAMKSTLSHLHHYYVQWRLDQGIPTEMLLR